MEIVSIFDAHLYSFKYAYEEFDELERLFDEWNDIDKLRDFFEENNQDLKYFQIQVDEAIIQTKKEAGILRRKLIGLCNSQNPDLDSLFANLDDYETRTLTLAKQKSKRKWLRLYALRIDTNAFVITGGAIKLILEMKDRSHTAKELDKLEQCRNFLKNEGVFDIDSFTELTI
jgi:hypothetical protein